jgi:hypothetical protein
MRLRPYQEAFCYSSIEKPKKKPGPVLEAHIQPPPACNGVRWRARWHAVVQSRVHSALSLFFGFSV